MSDCLQKTGTQSKKRVEWVDVAKGMVIIFMVFGHAVDVESKERMFVFSFHMPFFIFISGVFFKNIEIKQFFKKNVKNLLVPYWVAMAIRYLISIWLWGIEWKEAGVKFFFTALAGISKTSQVSFFMADETGVIWFVPMLFCVKLLFLLISKISKGNEFINVSLVIAAVLMGLRLQYTGYWLPWSLDIALYGIGFYYVGYLLKKNEVFSVLFRNVRCNVIWFLIWLIGVSCWFRYEIAIRSYTGDMICVITALAGCLLCCTISYYLSKTIWMKRFLEWVGRGTMIILCLHHLEWSFIHYDEFGLHPGYKLAFFKIILVCAGYMIVCLLKRETDKLKEKYFKSVKKNT